MRNLYKKTSLIIISIVSAFVLCTSAQADSVGSVCRVLIPAGDYHGHFIKVIDDTSTTTFVFRNDDGMTGCVYNQNKTWGERERIAYDAFIYKLPLFLNVGEDHTMHGITFSSVFQKKE